MNGRNVAKHCEKAQWPRLEVRILIPYMEVGEKRKWQMSEE